MEAFHSHVSRAQRRGGRAAVLPGCPEDAAEPHSLPAAGAQLCVLRPCISGPFYDLLYSFSRIKTDLNDSWCFVLDVPGEFCTFLQPCR